MSEMKTKSNPRILVVTPEITYLPQGMGNLADSMRAKAGGLADVSASLVAALFELGADVHVALPHYRRMFNARFDKVIDEKLMLYKNKLPGSRIHLAEDRIFYYRNEVYADYQGGAPSIALAFQREVLNNIIPTVQPDLIHCNDWMTGLVPAMARRLDIRCLFTLHNIHTRKMTLHQIENTGIDAAEFWNHLYYSYPPAYYEESRENNPVDFLASGIFASHFINTVSPKFLTEMVEGIHDFVPPAIRSEVISKFHAGCASGILNAPDKSYHPTLDQHIEANFDPQTHVEGKRKNKLALQRKVGLPVNPEAPIFFWPSRLDPYQKGPELLTQILYQVVSDYWQDGLQVVFVGNGPYQQTFHDIVHFHNIYERVAVCNFEDPLSHLGYAAADFILIPSLFEPCGLAQMIGMIDGSLPIANDTGGLHDTIEQLDAHNDRGNGFLFSVYDAQGLRWAIDQAMAFHRLPADLRARQITRIMQQSAERFTHEQTAKEYFKIYEDMLERPLVR
jgi:starch synthase